jgi:hypothetical protein
MSGAAAPGFAAFGGDPCEGASPLALPRSIFEQKNEGLRDA